MKYRDFKVLSKQEMIGIKGGDDLIDPNINCKMGAAKCTSNSDCSQGGTGCKCNTLTKACFLDTNG